MRPIPARTSGWPLTLERRTPGRAQCLRLETTLLQVEGKCPCQRRRRCTKLLIELEPSP